MVERPSGLRDAIACAIDEWRKENPGVKLSDIFDSFDEIRTELLASVDRAKSYTKRIEWKL